MTKKLTLEQKIENLKKKEAAKTLNPVITASPLVSKKVPPKKINVKKSLDTNIVLLFDNSSSMSIFGTAPKETLNSYIKQISDNAKKSLGDTYLNIMTFDATVVSRLVVPDLKKTFVDANLISLNLNGPSTSIRDAIKEGLIHLAKIDPNNEDANLVFLITDGQENSSTTTLVEIETLIKEANAKGNYTLAVLCPPGNKSRFYATGIPSDNIREWETTTEGLQETTKVVANSLSNYYVETNKGVRASTAFFAPDLSAINSKNLNKNWTNISSNCKFFQVNQEAVITPFIEQKTKKAYVIGSAYYQLMKKEKVQAGKLILIRDRLTGDIYGDNDARAMIGLPIGVDITVKPGNHGKYDVYIQSTSTNRKLPRGTSLIIYNPLSN